MIFWLIIYAIRSYLGLGFNAVCSKWLTMCQREYCSADFMLPCGR